MFSYSSNYIYFFYNYELLVLVCFVFFFFFALISEKGQIGSYFQELSQESQSKLSKHLRIREGMILELRQHLEKSVSKIKTIMMSYETSSQDILKSLQYIVKKLAKKYTILQVKYYFESILVRTKYLSLQIRLYLTNVLISQRSYILSSKNASKYKILDA